MQNPVNPLSWGPREWNVFHNKALSYSSQIEKENMRRFYEIEFPQRIPCGSCKSHYQQLVYQFPPALDSQNSLFNWTVDIHNHVNQKIGKGFVTHDQARAIWQPYAIQEQQIFRATQPRINQINQSNQSNQINNNLTNQNKANPQISTTISTRVRAGSTISDNAHLSAGNNPKGTITFEIYRYDGNTKVLAHRSQAIPVNGNGAYSSGPVAFSNDDTHYWTAIYSGDQNNNSATSPLIKN